MRRGQTTMVFRAQARFAHAKRVRHAGFFPLQAARLFGLVHHAMALGKLEQLGTLGLCCNGIKIEAQVGFAAADH
jgi:hypothetical protein